MPAWRCRIAGREQGPFTDEQLVAMARDGRLAPTDLVWNPEVSRWDKANRLRGLFPAGAPTVPVAKRVPPRAIPGLPPTGAAPPGDVASANPESLAASDPGPFQKIADHFKVCGGA